MKLKVASSLLTVGEEIELARRVHGPDAADAQAARNEFVLHNLGLIGQAVAYYRRRSGLDYDDLFSEGVLALLHAVALYDPDIHHTRFATYATPAVMHGLLRHLLNSATVRVPRYLQDGTPAKPTSSPARAAQQALCIARGSAALASTQPLCDAAETVDPMPSAHQALIDRETAEAVGVALGKIPPLRAYILAHYFGLCGVPPRSVRSLAVELGLTSQRIYAIVADTAARIKQKVQILAPDKIL